MISNGHSVNDIPAYTLAQLNIFMQEIELQRGGRKIESSLADEIQKGLDENGVVTI